MLAHGDQSHRGKKEKQATREARLTCVGKKKSLLGVRVRLTAFFTQVRNCVETRCQEEQTGEGQEQPAQRIFSKPTAKSGRRRRQPSSDAQCKLHDRSGYKQPAAEPI